MLTEKIKTLSDLYKIRQELREKNLKVVFTNGVFDLLHRGHVEYLERARALGDVLILGLNSDVSVKKVKGPLRPFIPEEDRAVVLAALSSVNYICLFDEEVPRKVIKQLLPDVLVKGGDYQLHEIVGREEVEQNGGQVVTIPLTEGRSTSNLVKQIVEIYKKEEIAE
jgi:rfaE bifunctional protein nucleotidyltransferase chain/domain